MSLAKRIVPCLDIKDGQVVKGVKFLDVKKAGDPVERARTYEQQGADELVFLDISATEEGRETTVELVKKVAAAIFIPLTVGGGISSLPDIKRLLDAGADKVSVNSAAVKDPDFVKKAAQRYGSQCIVVAIDAKKVSKKGEPNRWEIFTHGGRKPTGIDAIEWAENMVDYGAGELLVTSMDRDGTKKGFDLELTREISERTNVPVIASGGVGGLEDLYNGFAQGKADAVLAASIFHFGKYTVQQVKDYLSERGIPMRQPESR